MKNKGSRKAIKHAKVMNIDRWKGSPHRAEAPTPQAPRPPGPQAPDPPFRSRGIAKPGPGGRGWVTGTAQPRPSLVQFNAIATNQKHSTPMIHKLTTPARGGGGMGLGAGGWGLGPRAGGGARKNRPVRWPVRWPATDRPFSKNRVRARCGGKSRSESRSPRLDLI